MVCHKREKILEFQATQPCAAFDRKCCNANGAAVQVSAMFHIASSKGPPPIPDSLSPEGKDFLLLCFNR